MRSRLLWLLLALLLALGPARVGADGHTDLDREARAIAKDLACPVCEGQSVADSGSALAAQIRDLIRKRLEEGWSREAIIAYLEERYGEGIRRAPPPQGFGGLLWLGAVLLPVVGLAIVLRVIAGALRARPEPDEAPLTPADLARLEALLERSPAEERTL